ncbi:hypothetical protein [Paraburkholderia tropica]|uniref:hypothetical protein n=1 Tax=Paraburkholderia tropica TaxID=92647 RepID=UPI002AB671BB|nr:hypothetical protein [Paraburkholderia tropica]
MADNNSGGKPILKIAVDDSEVQAAQEKLERLEAEKQKFNAVGVKFKPAAGGGTSNERPYAPFNRANTGDTGRRDGWKNFRTFETSLKSEKLTGDKSFISLFSKGSKDIDSRWRSITGNIEKSSKSLSSLFRVSSAGSFGLLGAAGGIGGLLAAAGAATVGAAGDLAAVNAKNRALGLKPGEEQAFDIAFAPMGGDSDLLAKAAEIKSNKQDWAYAQALGVNPQQIQQLGTADLARALLSAGADKYKQYGDNIGSYASGTGADKILSVQQMRQAASYGPEQWAAAGQRFTDETAKQAANQKALDDATKATQDFDSAITAAKTRVEQAMLHLAPQFETLANKAADWAGDILNDQQDIDAAAKGVTETFNAVGAAGKWLSDHLNKLFGFDAPTDDQKKHAFTYGKGSLVAEASRFLDNPGDTWKAWRAGTLQDAPAVSYDWMWDSSAKAQQQQQGSGDSISAQNNNPLNLRSWGNAPVSGGFAKFNSTQEGVRAAAKQLLLYANRDGLDTVDQIIGKWAPKADHNDTDGYIADVLKSTGFKHGQRLDLNDKNVLARLEAAMAQRESPSFKNLTPDSVLAMLNAPNNDMQRAGVQSAAAKTAGVPSMYSASTPAAYKFNLPDTIKVKSDVQITLTTPAGSNVAVTSGGLPG